ncbi:MAG: hypothetical protein H3C54_06190 [Taibaiella sp.]|nr:hypothetical protein [Taibaiella sp.]
MRWILRLGAIVMALQTSNHFIHAFIDYRFNGKAVTNEDERDAQTSEV